MSANNLNLSQWNLLYTSRIAAPSTSNSCLISESSMTGGLATKAVAGRTKVGVGGGGKVEAVDWMSNG